MPDPVVLGFDTSAAHCAAALLSGEALLGDRHEPLARGQAERLMPLLEEVLDHAGLGWSDLTAIAVGVGPGNFTGTRISVAAARGLSLSLGVPAIGVSMFRVMHAPFDPGPCELISLEGPRGTAYVQRCGEGQLIGDPMQIDPADPPPDLGRPALRVIGHRATEIAARIGADATDALLTDIAPRIARWAALRVGLGEPPVRPAPLYVRPPDAAPARDAAPVILE